MGARGGQLVHFSFRLPTTTRTQLFQVAATSGRPLAQLVRHAAQAHVDSAGAKTPKEQGHESVQSEDVLEVISTRLPVEMLKAIRAIAAARNRTASEEMREAIQCWLHSVDPAVLGTLPEEVSDGTH